MAKQLITLEIHYNPFDDDGELKEPPENWPIESALDHYGSCECSNTETITVRHVQASPPVYDDQDEERAKHYGTSLLELGIIR